METSIKIIVILAFLAGCQLNDSKIENINSESDSTQIISKNNAEGGELFNKIKFLDSLYFNIAFNQCDSLVGRSLVSKDFEFYHDQVGVLLDSAEVLASNIMVEDFSWICNGSYRKLIDESMEVFPLYEENVLYGAIQTANHQFFNRDKDVATSLRTNAKFIHLWIIEDDEWKLRRAFSYDHQSVNRE